MKQQFCISLTERETRALQEYAPGLSRQNALRLLLHAEIARGRLVDWALLHGVDPLYDPPATHPVDATRSLIDVPQEF